ncbi:chromosome partitioning protein ParA [Pseudoduganella sp. FT55W]|uniref:Chromosome partitioning protein ParA n=1 Tax=Duganella rivi TaxID=2666083 RepID=A0A7X4GXT7_9BURK|nr:division plane positioning ATPase MipZ [Duganella rivi]MYM70514.1 chromosome partitioning protein ParA [Duganella rivi]
MAIYAVVNKKGGAGKSTTSTQLITGLARMGRRAWGVDGDDEQKHLFLSLTARIEAGLPGIEATPLPDGPSLRAQVLLKAGQFDDVVIDVAANDNGAMRAALTLCDVVLFPFAPRSYEVWAFENTVKLLREMLGVKDFKVIAFLNKADPAGQEGDNYAAIATVYESGFPVITARLGDRKAISHASAQGRYIAEYKGAPPEAKLEIDLLVEQAVATANGEHVPAYVRLVPDEEHPAGRIVASDKLKPGDVVAVD